MKDSVKCNPAKSKMPSETLTRNYGAIMKEHENDPLFVCTKEWFQNACGIHTPKEDIILLMNLSTMELDIVCEHWYGKGWGFDKAFQIFSRQGNLAFRQTVDDLARQGNSYALGIASKDRKIGIEEENKGENGIKIVIGGKDLD